MNVLDTGSFTTKPTRNSARELAIFLGTNRQVPNIPLYLQDTVSFSFSSDYGNLMETPSNALVDFGAAIATGVLKAATGDKNAGVSAHNKYFGFQQWKGTSPVSFNVTINLHMGIAGAYNGKTEVYDPIMDLVELALPSEIKGGILSPPNGQLMDLLVSGFADATKGFNNANIQELDRRAGSGNFLSLRVGELAFLPRVILKRAEPAFATEFDENGYPISGTVTLEFTSAFSATKQLMQTWRKKGWSHTAGDDGKKTDNYYSAFDKRS